MKHQNEVFVEIAAKIEKELKWNIEELEWNVIDDVKGKQIF